MDLTHDWRSFQGMFYPRRRVTAEQTDGTKNTFLVLDQESIVAAISEGEDLSDWLGASVGEVQQLHGQNRKFTTFQRQDVDRWLNETGTRSHFYDQVEFLRKSAGTDAEGKKKSQDLKFARHFFLEGLLGWWAKVLPSSYGFLIWVGADPAAGGARVGKPEQSLLLVIRRGEVEGFHTPDLSTLSRERRQPADIVKYLSEKYLVPVQGMFVSQADWNEWQESQNPWKLVARAVRENRAKLVPFRWGITFLMATRAFLKV